MSGVISPTGVKTQQPPYGSIFEPVGKRQTINLYRPKHKQYINRKSRNGIVLYTGPRIRPPKLLLRGNSMFSPLRTKFVPFLHI